VFSVLSFNIYYILFIFNLFSLFLTLEQEWDMQKKEFIAELQGELGTRRALSPRVNLVTKIFQFLGHVTDT